MSRYKIDREPTKQGRIEALVRYAVTAWEDSIAENATMRDLWPRLYRLYRGILTGQHHLHKHNVHLPIILSVAHVDVSRKVQASFGGSKIVTFPCADPEEGPFARKQESLVNMQFQDANAYIKAIDLNLNASIYGTGLATTGWQEEVEQGTIIETAQQPLSSTKIKVPRSAQFDIYDGPQFEVIDNMDFGPQVGRARIENMDYYTRRYTLTIDEVRDRVEDGTFEKDAYDELLELGGPSGDVSAALTDARVMRAGPLYSGNAEAPNLPQREVEIIELVGRIPYEMRLDSGDDRVILSIANRKVLMRGVPFPHEVRRLPLFCHTPMPDPHFFWGTGKGEVLQKIQLAANKFTNQLLDLVALATDPAFVVSRDAKLNRDNTVMRPGRIFFTDGIPQQMWMPLTTNLSGAGLSLQAVEDLWRWGQQGTGLVQDTVFGQGTGSRITKAEFMGRQESVNSRLLFEAMLMERQWVEPMADWFMAANRQYMEPGRELMMLGNAAFQDPWTGQEVRPSRMQVTAEDLQHFYRARAIGASSRLAQQMSLDRVLALTNLLAQNPQTAATIQWVNWMKMIADFMELPNAMELIRTSEAAAEQLQMMLASGQKMPNTATMAQSPESFDALQAALGGGIGEGTPNQ